MTPIRRCSWANPSSSAPACRACLIVGLVEAGQTREEIVDDHPDPTVAGVEAAVAYIGQGAGTDVRSR